MSEECFQKREVDPTLCWDMPMSVESTLRGDEAFYKTASDEQWEAALDGFANSAAFDKAVHFLDDSRESIYREREDSQL